MTEWRARGMRATRGLTDPAGRISGVIFSSKAEYGVRLMVELGRQTPAQPTSLKAIAEAERLPLAYLEQVVARLKRAGLVMSARGAHGGYWLARPAEEITMDEVVQALEGAIAPMECFLTDTMERVLCSHQPVVAGEHQHCATKLLWMRVQGGIARSLQTTTLAELVDFSRREAPHSAATATAATEHVVASAAVPAA
jgi:Rrf2 family protein